MKNKKKGYTLKKKNHYPGVNFIDSTATVLDKGLAIS